RRRQHVARVRVPDARRQAAVFLGRDCGKALAVRAEGDPLGPAVDLDLRVYAPPGRQIPDAQPVRVADHHALAVRAEPGRAYVGDGQRAADLLAGLQVPGAGADVEPRLRIDVPAGQRQAAVVAEEDLVVAIAELQGPGGLGIPGRHTV